MGNIGMKSIVFLGAFALLIILALGDVPQESSQDVAEASEFGLLDRDAREAGRKKRKGNKRNKKGKRNGKKLRGRKRKNKGKGKGKAKSKGKQGTGRKGNSKGNGKGSNKKPRNNQRQTSDTVPAADVKAVFAEYRKGTNRLRQVKRIVKWISQIEKKEAKAGTEFADAAKALDEATNNGADCDGALANSTVKADVLELNNCSVSAKAACNSSNYAKVNESEATNCIEILEFSVNSTKAWLSDPKTSTYPPIYPDPRCVEFVKTNEPIVKTARENCIGTGPTGSFGQCSSILKKVPGLILSCGKIEPNGPPVSLVVTSGTSGRHRIFKFQQQFL